jgi:hypothetical protein
MTKLILLLASVSILLMVSTASANSITYTEEAFASGTLGGIPFSDAEMHITLIGDTSHVTVIDSGFSENDPGPGMVLLSVEGFVGLFTFTDDVGTYVNRSSGTAGFGVPLFGSVLATDDGAFSSYDLRTSIGPITNSSFFRPDLLFGTTAGPLNLTSVGDSTFTATTTTTSAAEPPTLLLLAVGLLALRRPHPKVAVITRSIATNLRRINPPNE